MTIKAKVHFSLCFILLFVGCKPNTKDAAIQTLSFAYKDKIDSLYLLGNFDAIRIFAKQKLETTAHNNILEKAYLNNAIGNSYRNSFHYDSAIHYCEDAYQFALQSKNTQIQAATGTDLLNLYLQSSIFTEKQDSLLKALEILEDKSMPPLAKGELIDATGNYYSKKNNRTLCLFTFSKALPYYEQFLASNSNKVTSLDSIKIGLFYIHFGDANRKMKLVEIGNEYLQKGRTWINRNGYSLAFYYFCMTDWDEFFVTNVNTANTYKDSLTALARYSGLNLNDMAMQATIAVGDYYFYEKQDYKTVWKYVAEAQQYEHGIIDPIRIKYLRWLEADLYLKESRFHKSLELLYSIQTEAKSWVPCERMQIVQSFAECYEGLGMTDSAAKYYKQFIPISTETYLQREGKIKQEAEIKYQNKINEARIEQQELVIHYTKNQRLWLLTCLVITILGLILLSVIYERKKKIAQKLNEQNEELYNLNGLLNESNEAKSKLFGIISHDLRAPISHLYQLLKSQRSERHYKLSPKERQLLDDDTDKATIILLDNMEDLLIWSKTQMQAFKVQYSTENLNDIYKRCEALLQVQIDSKQLEMVEQIPANIIIKTDANFLLTILRNVLHNAIKASPFKGKIMVSYEQHDNKENTFCLNIINQGERFTQQDYLDALDKSKTTKLLLSGLGLQIIDELSTKLNISVSFEHMEQDGTYCKLIFSSRQNVETSSTAYRPL